MSPSQNENQQESLYKKAIAVLNHHHTLNQNIANRSYARVNKTAINAAIMAFIVMSYFLHATLLDSSADAITHVLALTLNSVIALITFFMIREVHPLQTTGAHYWLYSTEYKRQIEILNGEIKRNEMERQNMKHGKVISNKDIYHQKRQVLVTFALTIADNLADNLSNNLANNSDSNIAHQQA